MLSHRYGALDVAGDLYRTILRENPKSFDANHLLGVVAFQQGQHAESLKWFQSALAVKDDVAELYANIGNSLKELGRCEEAERNYRKAIKLKPEFAEAHYNLGTMLHEGRLENLQSAEAHYRKALELNPELVLAHNNLGNLLNTRCQFEEALCHYKRALELGCDPKLVHPNFARCYENLEQWALARNHWKIALSTYPGHGKTLLDNSLAWHASKAYERALWALDTLLCVETEYPDLASADLHNNRGVVLQALKRFDEAKQSFAIALSLRADHASAFNNLGNLLTEQGRVGDAIASFRRAIEISPSFADAWCNMGLAYAQKHEFDAAIDCYDQSIKVAPEYQDAYANKAVALLSTGRFDVGWPLFEWRWKHSGSTAVEPNYSVPQWRGETDLHGKSILVLAEQGFGDTIQFTRLLPRLKALGPAKVILEVPKPLLSLLSRVQGADRVVSEGDLFENVDVQCPLMSLPLALSMTSMDFSDLPTPYLQACPQRSRVWAHRHQEFKRAKVCETQSAQRFMLDADTEAPLIELAWRGNPEHKNDASRSMTAAEFLVNLPRGPRYISLQKQLTPEDRIELMRRTDVYDPSWQIDDFDDTAALCSLADLIICVDTSVAHLAGALNKSCLLMLAFASDWRWLTDREDTPWYPNTRIFRQSQPGDWTRPLAQMRIAIEKLMQASRSGHS